MNSSFLEYITIYIQNGLGAENPFIIVEFPLIDWPEITFECRIRMYTLYTYYMFVWTGKTSSK